MSIEHLDNGHFVVYFTRYGIHLRQNNDLGSKVVDSSLNQKKSSWFKSVIRSIQFRVIGVALLSYCSWLWFPPILSVAILAFTVPIFITLLIILLRDTSKNSMNIPWERITKTSRFGSAVVIRYMDKNNAENDIELKDFTDSNLELFEGYCGMFKVKLNKG